MEGKAKRRGRPRAGKKPEPAVMPDAVIQTGPNRVRVDTTCPRCKSQWTGRTGYDPLKVRQRRECKSCQHTFWVDRREP